jgi:hypothetical protein
MSKVVKMALPILGGAIGTMFGMPMLGYAAGGYLGGRAYGGGSQGGIMGALTGMAGGAAAPYLQGLASGATQGAGSMIGGAAGETLAGSGSELLGGATFGSGGIGATNYLTSSGIEAAGQGAGDLAFQGAGESIGGNLVGGSLGSVGGGAGLAGGASLGAEVGGAAPGFNTGESVSGFYGPTAAEVGPTGSNVSLVDQGMNAARGAYNGAADYVSSLGQPAPAQAAAGQRGSAMMGTLRGASGIYALMQADEMRKQSDPFRRYRDYYGGQLENLERNPGSITTRPGYQAGLQAVQRAGAAQGLTGSGNMAASLAKYGGGFYQNEVNRLAGLAGGNVQPGAGLVPAATLAGQGLATLGYGAADYFDPYVGRTVRRIQPGG